MKNKKKELNSNILRAIRQTFLLSIFASVAANAGENPPPDDSEYTVAADIKRLEGLAFHRRSFPRGFTFEPGSHLISIGDCCFCGASIPSICIPKSVKRIEDRAFFCSRVEAVDLEQCRDVSFGRRVFMYSRLATVKLPSNMISVPEGMFARCGNLVSISIPDSVLALQMGCFYESGLREITLPPHLVSIGSEALEWTDIERLIIPSSVLRIDDGALMMKSNFILIGRELTFKPSAEARWFNSNILWRYAVIYPKINGAFFVSEIPLRDLMDRQGFNEFAAQINLGQDPLTHSVLVRWSVQDARWSNDCIPVLDDIPDDLKSQMARMAQLGYPRYIYVPGNNDTQFQRDLMNGKLQVVQTGFCDQQIKAQAQRAQTRIDAAVQARAKARSGTLRRSRSSGAVNRAGSSSVSSTMSSDAVSKP